MRKPDILYHASSNRDIEIFEPRNEYVRDINEGPVIFATPDKAYASCFLVNSDDSWVQISRFGDVRVIAISDEERYRRYDKGGAIYELPSTSFVHEIRGTAKDEWTSREAVRPISKTEYASGLEAMLQFGVQVYFVDKSTFMKITNADDHGVGLLETIMSKNQEQNINIHKLPL